MRDAINALGFKCDEASIEMIPKNYVECDLEDAKANLALIEWIEALDDVDAVYHNMKILTSFRSILFSLNLKKS